MRTANVRVCRAFDKFGMFANDNTLLALISIFSSRSFVNESTGFIERTWETVSGQICEWTAKFRTGTITFERNTTPNDMTEG